MSTDDNVTNVYKKKT